MSKVINGVRRYLTRTYDLENHEELKVYWSSKEFEFAQFLSACGVMAIVPGYGYFYKFSQLKKAMEEHGRNPYWKDVLGIPK